MPYSLDLRLKVMEYLESGGKADLEPIKVKRRQFKFEVQQLGSF
jgi:hypothetical protein